MVVQNISNSCMKIKIRRKTLVRPTYNETTTTPFEILLIKGNIAKCIGCRGKLKEGSNKFLDNADKEFCTCHKEKDHIFLATHGYWKQTFSNKYYYLVGREHTWKKSIF